MTLKELAQAVLDADRAAIAGRARFDEAVTRFHRAYARGTVVDYDRVRIRAEAMVRADEEVEAKP